MEQPLTEVPFVLRTRKGDQLKALPSPVDLQEKQAVKTDLGPFNYDNMWKSHTNTLITNTGKFLDLELTSPGVLRWKPAGDVSYAFSNIKFMWAYDDCGSVHSIEGKKHTMEMICTFKYSYEVEVPPEIIFKRIELHNMYRELANTTEEEPKRILGDIIDDKELAYNEAQDSLLNENYLHSVGKEALYHRKPTSFHIGGLKGAAPFSNDDDDVYGSDVSEGEETEEDSLSTEKDNKGNFYRRVKFKKEREAMELAARRFYPFYASYMERKAESEKKGSIESAADLMDYLTPTQLKPVYGPLQEQELEDALKRDDPPIDDKMFPTERDKERERDRRAKYREDKLIREKAGTDKKFQWITNHKIDISLKFSVLFEVLSDIMMFLVRCIKTALTTTEYFTYVGGRLFAPGDEVIRIVKKTPLPIRSAQIWELKNMKNEFGKRMESTITPTEIQKLHGRDVFYNVPTPEIEPPTCPGKEKCMCEMNPETIWQAYASI